MSLFTACTAFALLCLPASPVTTDAEVTTRRVEASLRMDWDLDGPTYLQLVMAVRPRKLYDRSRDPSIPPLYEYGRQRALAAIKVDVMAVVVPFEDTTPYVLGLDNFAYPRVSRSKVDPRPFERAIARAIQSD